MTEEEEERTYDLPMASKWADYGELGTTGGAQEYVRRKSARQSGVGGRSSSQSTVADRGGGPIEGAGWAFCCERRGAAL